MSRRRGREKLHYLNPVPIRLIHDRWGERYTASWAAEVDLEDPFHWMLQFGFQADQTAALRLRIQYMASQVGVGKLN